MSRFTAIDLSGLPAPAVVQVPDYAGLVATRKADVVARVREVDPETADALAPTLAIEGELITKLIESGAYRQTIHYQRVNDAARSVMLAFAAGSDLDQLGVYYGVVRMGGEKDDRLRQRIQLAPEAFATAGAKGAYIFHTMGVDVSIKAVGLDRPAPGHVHVFPIVAGGDGTPSETILTKVRMRLADEAVKPETDILQVLAPQVVPYQIVIHLSVAPGPDRELVRQTAELRVRAYMDSRHGPGVPVHRTAITAAAHVPGVERLDLIAPAADVVPTPRAIAHATEVTLTATTAGV